LQLDRPGNRDRPDSRLLVTLDEYNGHRYLGLRVWERARDGSGFFPTKAGITIRRAELASVLEALGRAAGMLGEGGVSAWQIPPARSPRGRAGAAPFVAPSDHLIIPGEVVTGDVSAWVGG
jgi:hypothetical protein